MKILQILLLIFTITPVKEDHGRDLINSFNIFSADNPAVAYNFNPVKPNEIAIYEFIRAFTVSPVKEMQRENPNYLIIKSYKISINFSYSKI